MVAGSESDVAYPLIAGRRVATSEDFADHAPSTGDLLARVGRSGSHEVDLAVEAARSTLRVWSSRSARDRADVLIEIPRALAACSEELARLECLDTGKPLAQARVDVAYASRYFEYYGRTIEGFAGETIGRTGSEFGMVSREPYGVTAHIVPWNYPIGLAARTVAPALAVGNCCVLKPAEETPLSALRMAELASKAGLPPGALNVVTGFGHECGAALANHEGINHLSFTGSVDTGRTVGAASARNLVPCTLELGGKSANIVFADADLSSAAPAIAKSILQNAGQTCSAGSRLLIDSRVHDELLSELVKVFESATIGPGLDSPALGSLISEAQRRRVLDYIKIGRKEADLVTGGGIPSGPGLSRGWYVEPTIFDQVPSSARISREEIFGPVLTVAQFEDVNQAVDMANDSPYGLVGAIWTRDVATAFTAAQRLVVGQVMVNTYASGVEVPFGGRKNSGYGVEKGLEALLSYSHPKSFIVGQALPGDHSGSSL